MGSLEPHGLENDEMDGRDELGAASFRSLSLHEDASMLWQTYFDPTTVVEPLHAPSNYINVLEIFVTAPVPFDAVRAQESIIGIQQAVYKEIEERHFSSFKKSPLYTAALVASSSRSTPIANLDQRAIAKVDQNRSMQRQTTQGPGSSLPTALALRVDKRASVQVTTQSASALRRFEDLSNNLVDTRARSSDSLSFLMTAPSSLDRTPLFQELAAGPANDAADDEWTNIHTIDAIQDALTSILASSGTQQSSTHGPPLYNDRTDKLPSKVPLLSPSPVESDINPSSYDPKGNAASTLGPTPSSVRTLSLESIRKVIRPPIFDDPEIIVKSVPSSYDENEANTDPSTIIDSLPQYKTIAEMDERIQTLEGQREVIEALIRKAELTGNIREVKLLEGSNSSVSREIQSLSFQKEELSVAAVDKRMLVKGQLRISIPTTSVGQSGGSSFICYLIEVRQLTVDGQEARRWYVTRRYSNFIELDKTLKDKIRSSALREANLPGKRIVTSMSSAFIQSRRTGLEKYLQVWLLVIMV